MRKTLIAVLVILLVFCAAAFADNGFDNFTGFGIGYGLSQGKLGSIGENIQTFQVVFSITEFGFFEKSPVGLFIDGTLFVATSGKEYTEHTEYIIPKDNLPVGLMGTIGPAFKFDMGKKADLLLGVGFQVYKVTYETQSDKREEFFYGVGLDIEGVYELAKNFAISLGVDGSFYFVNDCYYTLKGFKPYEYSYDEYTEYRVIPKVTLYYTF